MASIHKDPRGKSPYWYCAYVSPEGKRCFRSTKQTDRKKALEFCLKLEKAASAARAGELTERTARKILDDILESVGGAKLKSESLRAFAANWLAGKELSVSLNAARHYRKAVGQFLEFLGQRADKPLSALVVRDIEGYRNLLLGSGVSNSTLQADLKIIRRLLSGAQRQGHLLYNPAMAVDLPRAKSLEREVFSPEEVRALLGVADQEWKTLILAGYYLGIRLSDAARLCWDAVELANGVIFYSQAKTGRKVEAPLHPDLEEHLIVIAGDSPHGALAPRLSVTPAEGRTGLSNQFARIVEQAGLDRRIVRSSQRRTFARRSFHSLRHSFASALTNVGVGADVRMKLTGHASRDIHQRYSHVEMRPLREAIARLPRLTDSRPD
jgi:integrase